MKNMIENLADQYSQDPITRKIERVAAYVRVSHDDQKKHGLSLDAQKMKLEEYAEKNGLKIVGWYIDEGVSGRKLIKNRPELQRMIQDVETGKFDRIIFIKLDRFFRSVAEYHECMKRIAPVVWTATEEKYDLSNANGRAFVNMKLTIAELEADTTGERIVITNDYKVREGMPLSGSVPFGFKIAKDEKTGRKKTVKDPEVSDILEDTIQHFLTHQTKKGTVVYMHAKHHVAISYNSLTRLLKNPMLYGCYRGNPNYCEAYIDKETFDRIQEIMKRNVRANTAPNRAYLFSGLILCPHCGKPLKGGFQKSKKTNYGKTYEYAYKKYRCAKNQLQDCCSFKKAINEQTIEKLMLDNIEKYLEDAKIRAAEISDGEIPVPKHDIEDINAQIDRLNYSWQTGKIRKVEQYEEQYAELMEQLEEAEHEQKEVIVKDFSKVEAILHDGWKAIYNKLDDEHKRSFWRSFVKSIEIDWEAKEKKVTKVNFF